MATRRLKTSSPVKPLMQRPHDKLVLQALQALQQRPPPLVLPVLLRRNQAMILYRHSRATKSKQLDCDLDL